MPEADVFCSVPVLPDLETSLTVYFKEKLKSSGDKASNCRPF
jgi:hypothetical protein